MSGISILIRAATPLMFTWDISVESLRSLANAILKRSVGLAIGLSTMKKTRSLQGRLTLGFVGIMMMILGGYSGLTFKVADYMLTKQADDIGVSIWASQYKASVERTKVRLIVIYGLTIPIFILL